jgi:hypothetical protein
LTLTTSFGVVRNVTPLPSATAGAVSIETKEFALGEQGAMKGQAYVDQMVVECTEKEALANATLYVGTKQRLNDTMTWHGPYAANTVDAAEFFRVPAARWIAFRLFDYAPTAFWHLSAVEFFGHREGGRE